LFGTWVPDEWIMAVFERVKRHQEWNFRLLSQDRKSSEQFTGFHRGYHEMKA
jgi:hypothetical protein